MFKGHCVSSNEGNVRTLPYVKDPKIDQAVKQMWGAVNLHNQCHSVCLKPWTDDCVPFQTCLDLVIPNYKSKRLKSEVYSIRLNDTKQTEVSQVD